MIGPSNNKLSKITAALVPPECTFETATSTILQIGCTNARKNAHNLPTSKVIIKISPSIASIVSSGLTASVSAIQKPASKMLELVAYKASQMTNSLSELNPSRQYGFRLAALFRIPHAGARWLNALFPL